MVLSYQSQADMSLTVGLGEGLRCLMLKRFCYGLGSV